MAELVDPGAVALKRFRRATDGLVFDCRQLSGEYVVQHSQHGETQGAAGDWLVHCGKTGERRVVPATDFAAGYAPVEG